MVSHRDWRKIAKKERRRKIRKAKAIREAERSSEVEVDEDEETRRLREELEHFESLEAERIRREEHEKWLRTEAIAREEWRRSREKLLEVLSEKARRDSLIREEWEKRQNAIRDAEIAKKHLEDQEMQRRQELTDKITRFIEGEGELPEELLSVKETNPSRELCPFYSKIGICRFGDNCSRNHRKPGVTKVLLVKNFYSHFGIEQSGCNEYDTDILLEYDDTENREHFNEFFNDVFPEFDKIGKIVNFKVCCNFERHLRGNMYIEYSTLCEAVKAYNTFHGRWYGGKQISLQFCHIPSWKQAICGLFASNKCPKGRACNFLHVFRNPIHESYEKGKHIKYKSRKQRSPPRANWRWSETPELSESVLSSVRKTTDKFDRETRRSHKRSRQDYRSKSDSRRRKKSKKSPS